MAIEPVPTARNEFTRSLPKRATLWLRSNRVPAIVLAIGLVFVSHKCSHAWSEYHFRGPFDSCVDDLEQTVCSPTGDACAKIHTRNYGASGGYTTAVKISTPWLWISRDTTTVVVIDSHECVRAWWPSEKVLTLRYRGVLPESAVLEKTEVDGIRIDIAPASEPCP